MIVIQINNLKKHFGKIKALDGVDFEVNEGEIFGFLGPNGAGKTTTIRCIMDFINPTSGEINIFGRDSHKDSVELKKLIGYLPSENRLYSDWTGYDHVDFIAKLRGKDKIADILIKKLDYDPSRIVKHLSTGNRQKLSFILALINKPKLLILDEPTNGLDPLLQNKIYEILHDLQKEGTTILMSSHNLHEVEEICTRAAIIDRKSTR
ncbi:MAG: antibiotic transport system ATP-binding protein, partial [Candidatus Berkelbacteria bacterium Licking1014_85]